MSNGGYLENLIHGVLILYAVGLAAGITRIIIRTAITGRPSIEEYLMFVAMLFWTGDVVLSITLLRKGTNQLPAGTDRALLSPEEVADREIGSKALVAAWFCYITFIWGAKTCLLLFYRRLMSGILQIRAVKLAAVLLVATYISTLLSMFLICRPFRMNWQVVPDPGPQCTDGYEYVWIIGICNIITDAVLLAIPLPVVVKLRVSTPKKGLLVLLFGSGVFVMVATSLRIYFTIGGDIRNLTFWCMIETASAMLVVNAPGIISIYGHLNRNGRADHELRSHSADFHPHAPPIPQIVLPAKTIPGSTRTTCSSPNQLAQANRLSNHIPGWKPLSGSSGFSSPRSKRSRTPDVEHGHHGRDSAEHIIGFPSSGEKENAKLETTERSMVIHQEISYAVTEEYCPVPYDQQSHNHNRNSDYYYEDGARISRRSRDKRSSRGSGAYDLENIDFDSEIEDGDPEDINNGGGEDPEYTSTRTSTGGHGGTTCTQSGSGDSNGMEIVPAMLNDHQMHGVKESEGI